MKTNQRESWADFVKGITIYLVILGHHINMKQIFISDRPTYKYKQACNYHK